MLKITLRHKWARDKGQGGEVAQGWRDDVSSQTRMDHSPQGLGPDTVVIQAHFAEEISGFRMVQDVLELKESFMRSSDNRVDVRQTVKQMTHAQLPPHEVKSHPTTDKQQQQPPTKGPTTRTRTRTGTTRTRTNKMIKNKSKNNTNKNKNNKNKNNKQGQGQEKTTKRTTTQISEQ